MADAKLKLDHRGIQQYLDGKHGVGRMLKREGAKVLARAQASAPRDSGTYAASLHMFTTHTDRMVVRVGSDVDYALVVESDHGTLARALN